MSQKTNIEQTSDSAEMSKEEKSYLNKFGDYINSQAELVAYQHELDPETERIEFEWLISSLLRQKSEYIVEGAPLTCSMSTTKPQSLIDAEYRQIISQPKSVKSMSKIQIIESRNETINGQIPVNITDTKGGLRDEQKENGLNIISFGNCRHVHNGMSIEQIARRLQSWYHWDGNERAVSEIICKIKEAIAQGKGTCYCCMLLNPKWDNLPENYSITNDPESTTKALISKLKLDGYIKFNGNSGITMMSMLFCKNGGVISAKESGQLEAEMSFSMEYFFFLLDYETGGGANDDWLYAKKLKDGTVTIAGGVVLKYANGKYALGEEIFNHYAQMTGPISEEEATLLTLMHLESSAENVRTIAKEKGWVLTQNTFDALIDMDYNLGRSSLEDFKSCELIATGDLSDEETLKNLRKEILETSTAPIDGQRHWLKNLAERRLDVIRIAQGGADAYTRNAFPGNWNQDAYQFYLDNGLPEKTILQYPIQKV